MGSINKDGISVDIVELVAHWERQMIDATNIDGPLDLKAKNFLVSLICGYVIEVLDTENKSCSAEVAVPPKRGRPRKSQSMEH